MSVGYPDGQRLQNWDSPTFYSIINQRVPAQVQSPIGDVSRYASVEGVVGVGIAQAFLTFQWYGDAQGNLVLGTRQFNLDPNINQAGQFLIPNMGPFLQVSISGFGGGDPSVYLTVNPTNRQRLLEWLPFNPVLIAQTNIALAASAIDNFYPSDYYGGPVYVHLQATQPASFMLKYLNNVAAFTNLAVFTQAANVPLVQSLIVPEGAWRLDAQNTNATAGTCTIRIWQSATGSS